MLGGSLDENDAAKHDFILLDQVETNLETEEGRELLRQHIVRERSALLIARFKAIHRPLKCEVCGFDFAVAYGEMGKGFIEAHHVKPLVDVRPGDKTKLEDLAAVCSNCHRMLHRTYPSMSVEKLRALAADCLSKSF
jgi:predicted HNH restriction endonuclease